MRLFVAMKETRNWGAAAAASPSGEWPRETRKRRRRGVGGGFDLNTRKIFVPFCVFCGYEGNLKLGRGRGGFAERGMATEDKKDTETNPVNPVILS